MDTTIINTVSQSAAAVQGIGQGVLVMVVVIIILVVAIVVLPAIALLRH
jgi:hypothetical protein